MSTSGFENIRDGLLSERMLPQTAVKDVLAGLEGRYQEPWRYYHNVEHIQELFAILDEYGSSVQDPTLVGWAFMYHDAIYDPLLSPGQSEESSAILAEQELPTIGLGDLAAKVGEFVRATANHDVPEADTDLAFFLDSDLAILGADQQRYDRYAADIRREYGHVPPELYVPGRIAVLQSLATRIDGNAVYATKQLRGTHEEMAQANITREIDRLKGFIDHE